MDHRSAPELEAGIEEVRKAPRIEGRVELIVRRPEEGSREAVAEGSLDPAGGLLGDNWMTRGSRSTEDGSADPLCQVTLMNARVAALVAGSRERWQLAGDQLYVDFDLGPDNLPPGTRLEIGAAVLEVSDKPHRGCQKFAARFGNEALRFVNSDIGLGLNLRGINTRIVRGGSVRVGDAVRKQAPSETAA